METRGQASDQATAHWVTGWIDDNQTTNADAFAVADGAWTDLGMRAAVREAQPKNASVLIDVMELPNSTVVRATQPKKADSPIDVTESAMRTEVRATQPSNAESPMAVTE